MTQHITSHLDMASSLIGKDAESPPRSLPSIEDIRRKTLDSLGRLPCAWQCKVAQTVLQGARDVVCISGTGSGKTLTFWIPLLFRPQGVQVIITPLNILGTQTQEQLQAVGISAIAVRGETATYANIEAIIALRYRVVAVSPEIALKPCGIFERVWKNPAFVSRLISVVWDEAHLLRSWSSFRPDLADAGRLRNILSTKIPFLLPSATLPEHALGDVLDTVHVRRQQVLIVRRSNDRPNVYLSVRKIRYALSSFKDLKFLVAVALQSRKFLVFFDNIEESIKACDIFRRWLPPEMRNKVVWFNADNTATFREATTGRYQRGELVGLFCTDAFGMGIDIPDIEVVVQWRPTCSLDSLWQRFGRAARNPHREALAVLLADAKYFDEEKEAARKRAEKRREATIARAQQSESGKRKRMESSDMAGQVSGAGRGQKRARRETPSEVTVAQAVAGESGSSASLTEYESLRVTYRTSHSQEAPSAQKGRKGNVGDVRNASNVGNITDEVDCLINAATRPFRCYRKPITAFYENDRLNDDEQRCRTSAGEDCSRCTLRPSPVCCSLCTPHHPLFSLLPPMDQPIDKARAARASQVDTQYTVSETDIQLRGALHRFRRDQTVRLYGLAHLHELGPGAVMGDDILKRIIDCARVHKIRDLDGLFRETKWHRSDELGNAVLQLINE
ncbi:P-loop containing nucleoside triphosphate hydrolase protein [Cubamyces sp. BRFM 1775]|nr:P-loop containing nucleoside triphosphate hydrolase protein [Cubamyces sp. BRFM 1775]